MDNKLLQKLMEEDLFPSATPEEIKDREANRPLRVLAGAELDDILKDVLCSILVHKVDASDLSDYFMNGTSLVPGGIGHDEGIGEMGLPRVIEYLKKMDEVREDILAGFTLEQSLLGLVNKWLGEEYDKIEGF